MRCQAVTIGSAQGQVPAIFRHLQRPPRPRRAARAGGGSAASSALPSRGRRPGAMSFSQASRMQAVMDASSHAWLTL